MAPAAIAAGLLLISAQSGLAGECTQEHATYTDSNNVYVLAFEPVDLASSSSTHRFRITMKGSKALLDGYVMPSDPVDRTNGMLFHDCPDGDATGDDLAACTVWQGVIYGSDGAGITLLPKQGEKAASAILLPGFGPALRASAAWKKIGTTIVPWDVLTLKGCS